MNTARPVTIGRYKATASIFPAIAIGGYKATASIFPLLPAAGIRYQRIG
jgi:hypothetical protein